MNKLLAIFLLGLVAVALAAPADIPDEPHHDEPYHDEPHHDEPHHDEPHHDEPHHDESHHDENHHDEHYLEEHIRDGEEHERTKRDFYFRYGLAPYAPMAAPIAARYYDYPGYAYYRMADPYYEPAAGRYVYNRYYIY